MHRFLWTAVLAFVFPVGQVLGQGPAAAAVRDPQDPAVKGIGRYTTTDALGRTITFYLTDRPDPAARLPLAVFIQGSGCQSCFFEHEGRVVLGNGIGPVVRAMRDRCRVAFVEKPGVRYLDRPARPGGIEGATPEFLVEHTLDRWAEAVRASVESARTVAGVDGSRVLVFGHSEGGLVACRVAALDANITHVGSLAGGGGSQLYDLITLARRGEFYQHRSGDPEERAAALIEHWKAVLADPASTEKLFLGHPYRRWSTFCASSPIAELSRTSARVFIAQGVDDTAVTVGSFDLLYATLLGQGRDVTAERLEHADHSFATPGETPGAGWTGVMERIAIWFLTDPAPR